MKQIVCNRCGAIIPHLTEKQYRKADHPNGYFVELNGLGTHGSCSGWGSFTAHLCRVCKLELFKDFKFELEDP